MRNWTFYKDNPHILCFIVSIVFLLAAFFHLHSAQLSQDYIQTVGEVENVESHKKHLRGRVRTEYDFDVTWEMNGRLYEKRFEGQLDYRPEGPVDIWVSPDNTEVCFSSAEDIQKEIPGNFLIAIIAGILGIILRKKKSNKRRYISKAERIDRLENLQIESGIGFFAFLTGVGFIGYDLYKDYQTLMIFNPIMVDLMIVAGVGALICIGIFVYACIKLKQ